MRVSKAFMEVICKETIYRADASKPAEKTREIYEQIRDAVGKLLALFSSNFTDPELCQLLVQADLVLTQKHIEKGISFIYNL